MLREYQWLFQSEIYPTDIITYHKDIKDIDKELKFLQKYRETKIELGEKNKKVKEANREIAKVEFYYALQRNPDAVYTFLNVTSPTPKIKRVYHPVLQELDVDNVQFEQKMFEEVKGRLKVVNEFPIELKVTLLL